MLSNKWLTQPTDFWCARPQSAANLSAAEWRHLSAPMKDDGKYDQCSQFKVDFQTGLPDERPENGTETIACTQWEYDTSEFQVTQSIGAFFIARVHPTTLILVSNCVTR